MRVTQLWRYPVKSMQGERLEEAVIGKRGIDGDRQWAVIALETGKALTARREPRLLYAYARLAGEDAVEVVLPDGTVTSRDDELSTWLGYAGRAAAGQRGRAGHLRDRRGLRARGLVRLDQLERPARQLPRQQPDAGVDRQRGQLRGLGRAPVPHQRGGRR